MPAIRLETRVFRCLGSLLLLCFVGCYTSSVRTVKTPIRPRLDTAVTLMPIGFPAEVIPGEDWRKTGNVYTLPDDEVIAEGIYQYAFDGADIENLRRSILESLRAAAAFKSIGSSKSLQIEPGSVEPVVYLFVKIGRTEMHSAMAATCILAGGVVLKDQGGITLLEKALEAEGKSHMSVSAAKNAAIEEFVRQIATALDEI